MKFHNSPSDRSLRLHADEEIWEDNGRISLDDDR
jgi:hypothetical protein